mgnify:CR=1 FL=1
MSSTRNKRKATSSPTNGAGNQHQQHNNTRNDSRNNMNQDVNNNNIMEDFDIEIGLDENFKVVFITQRKKNQAECEFLRVGLNCINETVAVFEDIGVCVLLAQNKSIEFRFDGSFVGTRFS